MVKIYVFSSNLAGQHSRGTSKEALDKYGAIYGQAVGLQGQAYAIPTRDANLNTLSLAYIKGYVDEFLEFAKNHSEMEFIITRIGCGAYGHYDEQIAPMFEKASFNCILPDKWLKYRR